MQLHVGHKGEKFNLEWWGSISEKVCLFPLIFIYFYIYIYIYIYILWDLVLSPEHVNRFLIWGQPVGWPSVKAGHRDRTKLVPEEPVINMVVWKRRPTSGWKTPCGGNSRVHAGKWLMEKFSLIQVPIERHMKMLQVEKNWHGWFIPHEGSA